MSDGFLTELISFCYSIPEHSISLEMSSSELTSGFAVHLMVRMLRVLSWVLAYCNLGIRVGALRRCV